MPSADDVTRLQDAKSRYHQYATYLVTGSSSDALQFAVACKQLVGLLPQFAERSEERAGWNLSVLAAEGRRAEQYGNVAAAAARVGARTRYFDTGCRL